LTFEEIGQMSKFRFKSLFKEKTKEAAFKYLLEEKSKQTNILDLQYNKLEIGCSMTVYVTPEQAYNDD
jgi:hypothetical protein